MQWQARRWGPALDDRAVDGVRRRLGSGLPAHVDSFAHGLHGFHTASHRRRKHCNPGVYKKTRVAHEDLARGRVYREGVRSVVGVYFV